MDELTKEEQELVDAVAAQIEDIDALIRHLKDMAKAMEDYYIWDAETNGNMGEPGSIRAKVLEEHARKKSDRLTDLPTC